MYFILYVLYVYSNSPPKEMKFSWIMDRSQDMCIQHLPIAPFTQQSGVNF